MSKILIIHENFESLSCALKEYYIKCIKNDTYQTFNPTSKPMASDVFVAMDVEIKLNKLSNSPSSVKSGLLEIAYLWPEKAPFISWLYIEPEYRGQKIAKSLINKAKNHLKSKGYTHFYRSACSDRPSQIEYLKSIKGAVPAGQLLFPDSSVEYFFLFKL